MHLLIPYAACSAETCQQIVKQGYFMDWKKQEPQYRDNGQQQQNKREQTAHQPPVQPAQFDVPAPSPQPQPVSEWAQALARRNAQVRSTLQN